MIAGARALAWWQLLLYPTVGAFAAWLIMRLFVRGEGGTGLSDVMEAVSVKRGPIRLRSALSRAAASLGIIVTGGSVGREGPIITISAAASSFLTRFLRAPVRDRGMLLGCGVAAGFSAAYNAPIAGTIFALEIILGNFAIELLAPVAVASVMATLFTRHILDEKSPIFVLSQEPFRLHHIGEVLPYIVLGVLAGVAAAGFQWSLKRGEVLFRELRWPRVAKMMLGGFLIGVIALRYPEVWGNGYGLVNEVLNGTGPRLATDHVFGLFLVMIALMTVKMIGTSITVGSGGAGGVFTPTLFVGATLGGAFGALMGWIAPEYTGPFGGYALVGMGCLVAGTTRAPIMALLVIFEMTMDYQIVLPLMLGCITASLVARQFYKESIYTEALAERGVTTPRGLEETVLVQTRVTDVMRHTPTWVSPATTYQEILPLLGAARATVTYVCGDDMRLLGTIRVHDVIQLSQMGDLGPTIVAADLMMPASPVTPQEQLAAAFEAYQSSDLDELPVVRDLESMELEGIITRKDVMAALHLEVLKRQNLLAKFVRREDEEARTDYVELPEGIELGRVPVHPEHLDKTLGEAQIRARHHITVLSVVRADDEGGELRILPSGSFVLHRGDELIVMGPRHAIESWRVQCGDL
jgi:CIC family chloride channel protein